MTNVTDMLMSESKFHYIYLASNKSWAENLSVKSATPTCLWLVCDLLKTTWRPARRHVLSNF